MGKRKIVGRPRSKNDPTTGNPPWLWDRAGGIGMVRTPTTSNEIPFAAKKDSMNVFQRIDVGLRAWFGAWFIEGAAEAIAPSLDQTKNLPAPTEVVPEKPVTQKPAPAAPPTPRRSDALLLLEVLQREARLIDFLMEDLSGYNDAQIGAAVRDVHRDSGKALQRIFAIQPVMNEVEGTQVSLSKKVTGRERLVGNVREGVSQGTLVHSGWEATHVELPQWTGTSETERIIAPAEIEV